MLSKKFRLPLNIPKNLNWNSFKGDYFVFKERKNDFTWSRFGVVISGKNLKGAVKRNNAKRIVFNYIRTNKIHLIPGKDYVFIALKTIAAARKKEIEQDLSRKIK